MKKAMLIAAMFTTMLVSCGKDPVEPETPVPANPEIRYIQFLDYSVRYAQRGLTFDLDEDGKIDGFFSVQLVGDPINKVDKRQWLVVTDEHILLPINYIEQAPVKRKGDLIPLQDFEGYQWWGLNEVTLIERAEFANGNIIWRGNWQGATRQYLPVQVVKNGLRYNGWFEISADVPGERIIIHRAGISKEPEKPVFAGR
ncbi:MAG: hypothetical protein MUE58_06910 [Chitinophagaceae bacterium]|nr:hypothetical protein [Chitinophagaceae bacterium]